MKIRLALLDDERTFLERFSARLSGEYEGKFELYLFSNLDLAIKHIEQNNIDVFLASENFVVEKDMIPSRCGFAYLVSSKAIKTVRDLDAICKFQQIDELYKAILGLYSDLSAASRIFSSDSGESKIVCFTSASGGNGCSTCAAAFAKKCVNNGKKTLYLNLEPFGDSSVFFHAEGQLTFSDIIYSIKQKRNISLKIESCAKKDESGVYFFESPESPLHMSELSKDDIEFFINSLRSSVQYDVVVVDIAFNLDEKVYSVIKNSSAVIFVSDGSKVSNGKFVKAYSSLEILEKKLNTSLIPKSKIIYNKYRSSHSSTVDICESVGICPMIEKADPSQITEQMLQRSFFDNLK